MTVCTRNGCKIEFVESDNEDGACVYHPGTPVFHEGLKSWSCCSDVNKPELDFDEFMKIKGCTIGKHTTEAPHREKPRSSSVVLQQPTVTDDGQELFSTHKLSSALPTSSSTVVKSTPQAPAPEIDEIEDLDAQVPPGTKCRRNGCKVTFECDAEHRVGDGGGTVCMYHPKPPIFHEGSKGYLCCKRRVLEFDEFLKIEGCKRGTHLFVPKKPSDTAEVLTTCRIDFYQTPKDVHISVFAKKADQERSVVTVEDTQICVDLHLPEFRRFKRTLNLYGPIIPSESSHKFFGTKVELILRKADNRSWNLLERTDQEQRGVNYTFGVGGRTGTVGAREPILSADTVST